VPIALQPSFDDLSTPLFDVTFCVLDLETTGGSAANCEITEIGAAKYRGGDLLGTFQTLVDPGAPIPPSITILTGITQAMVFDAPRIESVLPAFLEFVGDSVVVGHNVRFDLSFLNAAASRLGYDPLSNQSVDTAGLARRLIRSEVRNLRLRTLAAHFRSPITPIHRALEDALATAHVLHSLLERAGSLGVTNMDDLVELPRARGATHYSKISLTESLPRRPGVYVFRDRHGTAIYVGKASNLRSRVRQYFYGDTRRTIGDLLRELQSIDHQECQTEVEAEVTELRLIHAHRPRYNRKGRPPKASHFVKLTREEFPRLAIVRTLRENGLAHLGPFRSKKAAELVMTAIWDSLPIRRCNNRPGSRGGRCAPAQLGIAMCPCDGTLSAPVYESVIDRLLLGIDHEPDLLLGPLVARMESLASEQRFEEAAWMRDRHDALARAIQRRHTWRALQAVGLFEIETTDGTRLLVDHGRLVSSWTAQHPAPLRPVEVDDTDVFDVPAAVETAEESQIIWKWMTRNDYTIIEASGTLSLPTTWPEVLTRSRK
jgi:DNA polymerase III subunit epsilon